MLQLSTRRKIAIAKVLNRLVRVGRRLCGQPMQGTFRRGGLNWELDLNEGIDFAIWLRGEFEPELGSCYRKTLRDGATVLDIGANIGAHTLPLAKAVGPRGKVVAVEATEYAVHKLRRNLQLNPELAARTRCMHSILVADSKQPTEQAIASSWPLEGDEAVHPTLGGALRSIGAATVLTVDELVAKEALDKIALIKMDVDGHELGVLQGARHTLNRQHPPILMELAPYCHTPGEFEEIIRLLTGHGYRFFQPPGRAPLPDEPAALLKHIPKNGSINVIAAVVV